MLSRESTEFSNSSGTLSPLGKVNQAIGSSISSSQDLQICDVTPGEQDEETPSPPLESENNLSKTLEDEIDINSLRPFFNCVICSKTISYARTITECMHSFCRDCITEYLAMTKNCSCPMCGTDLGYLAKESLKADKSLQSLLKRLFPEIPQDVDENSKTDQSNNNKIDKDSSIQNDGLITFHLHPDPKAAEDSKSLSFPSPFCLSLEKPFIRTSRKATILQIRKLLELKLQIPESQIEISLHGTVLKSEWSVEFVSKYRCQAMDPDRATSSYLRLTYGKKGTPC